MNYSKLKESWEKEEKATFKGWDFSHLENRCDNEELPWKYEHILNKYLKPNHKLLDMGTGGGEFLLSLNHPYNNTSVTEMWPPNVELCKEKLAPLGIEVKHVVDDSALPFKDNSFDIIINRHEFFDIREVKRILKPDGIFITQQVGGKNNEILSNILIKDFIPLYADNTLEDNLKKLGNSLFEIIYANEYFPYLRFKDIGAVVYFAKIIEWEFPNFSVENSFKELCKLQDDIIHKGYVESIEQRYIIVCRKNIDIDNLTGKF